jgi:chromosome segregation ATPase
MAEQSREKFRFGMGVDTDDAVLPSLEEPPDGRKRISIGIYIILVILIMAMIAAYFDLYRRLDRSQSIGSNQVENLGNQISSLSVKHSTLETQLTKKISDDTQVIKEMEDRFNKVQEAVQTVQQQLAAKTNKSDLDATFANIKKEIEGVASEARETLKKLNILDTNLKTFGSDLITVKENLSGEIDEMILLLDRSSKNLIELESRTNDLAATKIDKPAVDKLIKKHLDGQQPISNQISSTLSDQRTRIDVLNQQWADLKKNAAIYETEILKIKRQLKQLEASVLDRTSKISPSTPTQSDKTGDLLQQTLKE